MPHAGPDRDRCARRNISPAALLGFAQSLDKALAWYEGAVAFRIVRKDAEGDAQLLRLAPKTQGSTQWPGWKRSA